MTHGELVEVAYKWVLKNTSCKIAFKELEAATTTREIPDVIGFCSTHSVLVECKTSRADFLADLKKPFRINPELGMGTRRFYCCHGFLLQIDDLLPGWGLIHVDDDYKIVGVYKPYKGNASESDGMICNKEAEWNVLYSALRRLKDDHI